MRTIDRCVPLPSKGNRVSFRSPNVHQLTDYNRQGTSAAMKRFLWL